MFELHDSAYVNSLSNTELAYIYDVYQSHLEKIKKEMNPNTSSPLEGE